MIAFHVVLTNAPDYATRREAVRQAHLQRIEALRAGGAVIAGGPSPDGRIADLFYRLQQPAQLELIVKEDPYWTGGVWTDYTARSFSEFVEPWELPPVVTDGSRRATIVEGPSLDRDMGQFALIELRGAGRLAFAGFFDDGSVLAVLRTTDEAAAMGWLEDTGFWAKGTLRARPFVHVL